MKQILQVDLCVIGAGAAGLSVAAGAVQLGLDVALVEKGKMGGDCLNTGCVPSKSLLAAAKAAHTMRTGKKYGIRGQEPDIDFKAVKKHVADVIKGIEPHDSQERFEGLGIKVFRDAARFTGKNTIQTGDQTISAKYFVIATGSRAAIPPIEGLDPLRTLTNETIFELEEKPDHLVIIGGGPIGIEMAQAHRRLGCKVTVLDMGAILPRDDSDLVEIARASLLNEGVKLMENVAINKVTHSDGGVTVTLEGGDGVKGSHLLVAAGRQVNIDGLDLEKAGVAYDKRGIQTDGRLRTSSKHIYAAGDVAGGPQFTHIAGYHAGIIVRNMIFKMPAKFDYSALPWVTYTDPELAQVGLTEKEAKEKYGDSIKISKANFKENDRARADKQTEGCAKIIMKKNGRVIGASIIGPHAGELISLWGLVISQKMKIGAVANMIVPYPTYAEISKRAAGAYFTSSLFSDKTRFITGLLQKLPF